MTRRHPANPGGAIQLGFIHNLAGRSDEGLRVIEEAIQRAPRNPELWRVLVEALVRKGRTAEARQFIDETLRRLPRNLEWRRSAVHFLVELSDENRALEVAREGVVLFPRGPYLWYLLGETLDSLRNFAAQGEIERCFRRSLELNRRFFAAADLLAMSLAGQRRFEEAEEVVRGVEGRGADPSWCRGRLAWVHREQGRRPEALEEMVSVLRAAPWYHWGWSVLIAWLTEDEAWDRAKSLLATIPPEIRTQPQLLKDRLRLLERAGLRTKELDAEWDRILGDFPEDAALHQERYDSLRDAKRIPEAAAVLRRIQPLDPDDPFMNARLVEVFAREHKREDAAETLCRVFFAPVERSEWPAAFAWQTVRNANFADEAFQAVGRRLKEGARPTPCALTLWASFALERGNWEVQRRPQPLWRTWFPGSGAREVLAMLNGAKNFRWVDERYRVRIFSVLSDFGYYALVAKYWRGHRTDVEGDPESCAQTARALIELGRRPEARELMTGWPERPGIRMWMIANFIDCFSGVLPTHLREIRTACTQALSALPHDHCARYLAHVGAEACALLDDKEGFLVVWKEHRAYFDGEISEGEWFKDDRRHLMEDIPKMVQFLEQNAPWKYRTTLWRLRWGHLSRTILSSRPVRSARRISFVVWWLLLLGSAAVLVNIFKDGGFK